MKGNAMTTSDDRVWFITGASSGIGRSLALEVLARGGRVAATARDAGRLDGKLRDSGNCLPLPLEVADAGQCNRAVERTLKAFELVTKKADFSKIFRIVGIRSIT
jgi:NADP-dependent 3-hydroxy acid dehydrogenase YdfG